MSYKGIITNNYHFSDKNPTSPLYKLAADFYLELRKFSIAYCLRDFLEVQIFFVLKIILLLGNLQKEKSLAILHNCH